MATKKQKLEETNDSEEIDPKIQKVLEEMETIQKELDAIEKRKEKELIQIEINHQKERRPISQKRNQIAEKIPEFWAKTFQHHPILRDLLTPNDIQLLKYLKELDVETLDSQNSFRLTLKFRENEFLEDLTLWKEIRFHPDEETEPQISGSDIKWKPGKSWLTDPESSPKEGNKRPAEEMQGFFAFFTDDSNEDIDPIELAGLLKDEIWTDPIKFYRDEEDLHDDEDNFEPEDDQEDDAQEEGQEDDE